MSQNAEYELTSPIQHDDAARQAFVLDAKRQLRHRWKQRAKDVYEQVALPAFEAKHRRAPETRDEISEVMDPQPFWQLWGSLNRSAQDMMWDATCTPVVRDLPRLRALAEEIMAKRPAGGSLELDPDFKQPIDTAVANIHGQPGGYDVDNGPLDVTSGAFYEAGGALYSASTGFKSSPRHRMGEAVAQRVQELFPDLRPKRILEMGCSAGASSTAWPHTFPEAELHAIDTGASMLRYAHIRAEAMGYPIHFHQRDAGETGFADESFDLIVSHNLMHEISRETLHKMARESFRLLRPGGVVVHQDVPIQFKGKPLIDQWLLNYDTRYNDEPWWEGYATADVPGALVAAGFPADATYDEYLPKLYDNPGTHYLAISCKA